MQGKIHMKPFILALLGSVAFMAVPSSAHAQSMATTLDCDTDDTVTGGTPTPTPGTGGTGTSTGGTGTGTSTGGTGTGGTSTGGTGTGTGTGGTSTGGTGTGGDTTGGPGTGTVVPDAVPYMTNGNVGSMRVTSSVHGSTTVKYYRATGTSASYKQDLAAVKSYPTPQGNGVVKTVGGQKILAKDNNVKLNGLSTGILNVIDEINLTAAALGLPDPVITAGHDQAGHSPTSDHYTGNALDLRCNNVSTTSCKQWVITLQNALGNGYDVIFEDWGGSNSHVHISYG